MRHTFWLESLQIDSEIGPESGPDRSSAYNKQTKHFKDVGCEGSYLTGVREGRTTKTSLSATVRNKQANYLQLQGGCLLGASLSGPTHLQ